MLLRDLKSLLWRRNASAGVMGGDVWRDMAVGPHHGGAVRAYAKSRGELDLPGGATVRISRWLANARETASPFAQQGAQGGVYVCDAVAPAVIIKAPARKGLRRLLNLFFLRREFRAYQRLRGVPGIPRCHGLLHGSYLVLEHVHGVPRHKAVFADGRTREHFFAELLGLIQEMHRRGVAHGDLQNKNNLLVVEGADGAHPCVLDFGASGLLRGGFAPVSALLFRFLSRLDFNVWVKLKYAGRMDAISEADRQYYRRSWIEKAARRVKDATRRRR